jgi:hypothetical protein
MAANSIPEGLDVLQHGDSAVIRRTWFSHTVWFLVFFCVAWDSFLIFWYSMALGPHKNAGPMDLMAIIFPIGHVAVGVGLTYFVICTFLNKTDITLSESKLTIRTHPLPWIGNKTVDPADLTNFVIRERSNRNRNGGSMFNVMYVNRQNKECPLVRWLPNEEQAEYVAGALTRFYVTKSAA